MTLPELEKRINTLRTHALFGSDDDDEGVRANTLDPLASEEVLSALCYLELARAAVSRASLHQTRANREGG